MPYFIKDIKHSDNGFSCYFASFFLNNMFIKVFLIHILIQQQSSVPITSTEHPEAQMNNITKNNFSDLKPSVIHTKILKACSNQIFQINHNTRFHQVEFIPPLHHLIEIIHFTKAVNGPQIFSNISCFPFSICHFF